MTVAHPSRRWRFRRSAWSSRVSGKSSLRQHIESSEGAPISDARLDAEWADLTKDEGPTIAPDGEAHLRLLVDLLPVFAAMCYARPWLCIHFERKFLVTSDAPVVPLAAVDAPAYEGVGFANAGGIWIPLARRSGLLMGELPEPGQPGSERHIRGQRCTRKLSQPYDGFERAQGPLLPSGRRIGRGLEVARAPRTGNGDPRDRWPHLRRRSRWASAARRPFAGLGRSGFRPRRSDMADTQSRVPMGPDRRRRARPLAGRVRFGWLRVPIAPSGRGGGTAHGGIVLFTSRTGIYCD